MMQAIPVILVAIAANFVLTQAAPGDPAAFLIDERSGPEQWDKIRAELGLDKPAYVQLVDYFDNVLHLNLGYSFRFRQSVFTLITDRLPSTLLLTSTGFALSSIFGILLGILAARRANSLGDNIATVFSLAGYSMPVFWLGQVLLLIFAWKLDLFPTQGTVSVRTTTEGWDRVVDVIHHLALPALTYAVYPLTLIYRLTRIKMLDVLTSDFIKTAHAKGLSEVRILFRHALPNAFLTVLTVIGVNVGYLLAGSVLVETVFGWPGMGRLTTDAIFGRDYPLLLGILLVTTTMVIAANLITDILYAAVDPRVTYAKRERI
jgi:peptide/nickel transport system permease protein